MNIYSEHTLREINSYLKKGYGLRVDVGLSYNAPYLIRWVKTNKKIIVIGFEPHTQSFENLKIKISHFPQEIRNRVFIFNCAISNVNSPTSQKFFSTGFPHTAIDPGRSSLLEPLGLLKDDVVEIFDVSVISLDYFLERINFRVIEFIKIDTQGNDLAVLKSLKSHISKVYMAQFERNCFDYYRKAATGSELDKFMIHNNFIQVWQTKNNSDSLFVNKFITVLDFVPFRIDIMIRKFPITLTKIIVKCPKIFLQTFLTSSFYVLNANMYKYYFKLKHYSKMLLQRIVRY